MLNAIKSVAESERKGSIRGLLGADGPEAVLADAEWLA